MTAELTSEQCEVIPAVCVINSGRMNLKKKKKKPERSRVDACTHVGAFVGRSVCVCASASVYAGVRERERERVGGVRKTDGCQLASGRENKLGL